MLKVNNYVLFYDFVAMQFIYYCFGKVFTEVKLKARLF